jgi:hypothetical protein
MRIPPSTLVLLLFACESASLDLESESAEVRCPREGCEVDDPPDPRDPRDPPETPEPPPVTPTPPDPAKYRTEVIPERFLQRQLRAFLEDTKIQVSHTSGTPLPLHRFEQDCTTQANPEVQACKADCNAEPDLTPYQKAQCRDACEQLGTTTCATVCRSVAFLSYLRWGAPARYASSKRTCDASSCPACSSSTEVSSLEHRGLTVPVYDRTFDLGLTSHRVRCLVNQWVFHAVDDNLEATATSQGLFVRIAGTTGSPAAHCDGVPSPSVEDLALQIEFQLTGGFIKVEGALLGDWQVFGAIIDFVADFDSRISAAVGKAVRGPLNSPAAAASFRKAFAGLTAAWALEQHGETLDFLSAIENEDGGIRVHYFVR